MNYQNRVFMVESSFSGWRITELDEDHIIECHFTPRSNRDFQVPVGFDEFETWYEFVYRYKNQWFM